MNEYFSNIEDVITKLLHNFTFGCITVTLQDGKVVQVEKSEKFRLSPAGCLDVHDRASKEQLVDRRIRQSLLNLSFGQVTFLIRNGLIVQIERTEKKRLINNQGIYGDGI